MRIAATADLHFTPQKYSILQDQLNKVRDDADVFILAGDLTNYGKTDEMEPLINAIVRLRVPTIAVLGNHDYESGQEVELTRMMTEGGIKMLDGSAYERDGVGFAGTKGFVGRIRARRTHRFRRTGNQDVRASLDRRSAQAGAGYVSTANPKASCGSTLRAYCRHRGG